MYKLPNGSNTSDIITAIRDYFQAEYKHYESFKEKSSVTSYKMVGKKSKFIKDDEYTKALIELHS